MSWNKVLLKQSLMQQEPEVWIVLIEGLSKLAKYSHHNVQIKNSHQIQQIRYPGASKLFKHTFLNNTKKKVTMISTHRMYNLSASTYQYTDTDHIQTHRLWHSHCTKISHCTILVPQPKNYLPHSLTSLYWLSDRRCMIAFRTWHS